MTSDDPDGSGPCSAVTNTFLLTINALPVVDAGTYSNPYCTTDGLITLVGSPSGGTFTYNGSTVTTFDPSIGPGTYIITYDYTDGNTCSNQATSTIVVEDCGCTLTTIVDAGGPLSVCESDLPVTLNGQVSGAISTGTWSGGLGTFANPTDLGTIYTPDPSEIGTTVSLLLTSDDPDGSGPCSAVTSTFLLTINPLPVVDAGLDVTLFCGDLTISLNGTGSDLGTSYSYQWTTVDGNIDSGANSLLPVVSQSGTYTLTVENILTGCQSMDNVFVGSDVNAPTVVVTNPLTLTCEVLTLIIDATNSSSGPEFDYSWSTTNGNIVSGAKSDSPLVNKKGKYLLKLKNKINGCISTEEVTIDENVEKPVISGVSNDVITCINDEIDIYSSATGSGNTFDFLWNTTNGSIVSGGTTSTPTIDSKGDYSLIVKDLSNGCTSEKIFIVEEKKLKPDLVLAVPDEITCKQLMIQLSAISNTNGVTYNWTALTGNIVSGVDTESPMVNEKGDYQVVITANDNGCTSIETVFVDENIVKPVADAGDDLDIPCTSNSIQIGPSTIVPNYIYSWSTSSGVILSGENTANPVVSKSGDYLLVVQDANNGCIQDDKMVVSTPPKVLDLDFDVNGVLCNGLGGSIQVVDVNGGTPPYLFSFDNGGSFSELDIKASLPSGSYKIIVQDVMGCEYESYAIIPPVVLPAVETNNIYYIESGDSLQLQVFTSILPDDIDTITWSPSEYLSCTNCLNPIAKPLVSVNYDVVVMDKNGCDASAKIAIFVSDPDIYIPNVFSPNSDNLENSSFYIHAKPNKVKEITSLIIFDRWGNQVFEQEHFLPNDPYTGWDGKYKGLGLSPGVYIYHAVVEFVSGQKISYSGDVTIMK